MNNDDRAKFEAQAREILDCIAECEAFEAAGFPVPDKYDIYPPETYQTLTAYSRLKPLLEAFASAQAAGEPNEQLTALRRALEIIAVGDSKNPVEDAADELVAFGYWSADAVAHRRAAVPDAAPQPAAQAASAEPVAPCAASCLAAGGGTQDDYCNLTQGECARKLTTPAPAVAPAAVTDEQVKYVPVDSRLRDANWRHPNDDEPCPPGCREALDQRGDDEGQGLDGYWKWGFKAGWNACAALASQKEA